MGCVNFGVISMWIVGMGWWVCFFTVFFFFWLDAGVDLVAQWEAGGVDLERDGG